MGDGRVPLREIPACKTPGGTRDRNDTGHADDLFCKVSQPGPQPDRPFDGSEMLRKSQCDLLTTRGDGFGAQALDQVACVDADRAGCRAQSIHGAGIHTCILEIGEEGSEQGGIASGSHFPLAGDLAADNDPLARGQGQAAAGTVRFAKSAFDAAIHFGFDGGQVFQVADMGDADRD